jgi:hypothetical protein
MDNFIVRRNIEARNRARADAVEINRVCCKLGDEFYEAGDMKMARIMARLADRCRAWWWTCKLQHFDF